MYDIPCIIFAGGKSRRMGSDKALLPFGRFDTLTEFQLSKFTPYFQKVFVGCKSREKFDFEAEFIEDLKIYEDWAPFIGLVSVFETLDVDAIFVLSVDVPFFDVGHFEKLYEHLDNHEGIIAKSPNGKQPLCAIYTRKILPHLKKLINKKEYRFASLFRKISLSIVEFDDEKVFTNLNTKQDYQKVFFDKII